MQRKQNSATQVQPPKYFILAVVVLVAFMNSAAVQYYFQLQILRFSRWVKAQGFPILAAISVLVLGLASSFYAIRFVSGGPKYVLAISLYAVFFAQNSITRQKVQFAFQNQDLKRIKTIASMCIALFFALLFAVNAEFLYAFLLIGSAVVLPLFTSTNSRISWAITPFTHHPFEFTSGIRKVWFLQLVFIVLFTIGIQVGNLNLALAAIGFNTLSTFLFYVNPEPIQFVRFSNFSAQQYLWWKIKWGVLHALVYNALFLILGAVFIPKFALIIIAVQGIALIYLSALIAMKYAAFPNEITIPQALIFALGFWLPPVMLVVFVYFFMAATQNLKRILPE